MNEDRLKDLEKYECKIHKPINNLLHSDKKINKILLHYYNNLKYLQDKYGYTIDLISKLAVIQLSLNDLYGEEINDLFYETLNKTQIVFADKPTYKLLKDFGYDNVSPSYLAAYTNCDPTNIFTSNIQYYSDYILIGNGSYQKLFNNLDIMENLIHEFRHALSSQINTNKFLNENLFYKRCGLNEYFFRSDNEFTEKGSSMEEIFNVYFTDILVNNILNYKYNNINNYEISKVINNLEFDPKYAFESTSYSFLKKLCRPLLFNQDIIEAANQAALKGEFEDLYKLFKDYYGYVDELDRLSNNFLSHGINERDKFNEDVKKFKIKTLDIAERRI